MDDLTATVWIGIIVTVLAGLAGIAAWALATRRRHHASGLSFSLIDQHLGSAAAGQSARQVAYLNLRLVNNGDRPVVIDGLGYRRAGSHRPVPIRSWDVPGPGAFDMVGDTLLPPPYRLAPGASQTITIYAPTLCAPDDLAGIYLHADDGEMVWLPHDQVEALAHSCTWANEVASG